MSKQKKSTFQQNSKFYKKPLKIQNEKKSFFAKKNRRPKNLNNN